MGLEDVGVIDDVKILVIIILIPQHFIIFEMYLITYNN